MAFGRLVRRGEQRQDGGDGEVEGRVPVPEVAVHGLGAGSDLGLGGEGGAALDICSGSHLDALADPRILRSAISSSQLWITVYSKARSSETVGINCESLIGTIFPPLPTWLSPLVY